MTTLSHIAYSEGAGPRISPGLSLYMPGKRKDGLQNRILVQIRDAHVDPEGRVITHRCGPWYYWIWGPNSGTVWLTVPTEDDALRVIESLLENEA